MNSNELPAMTITELIDLRTKILSAARSADKDLITAVNNELNTRFDIDTVYHGTITDGDNEYRILDETLVYVPVGSTSGVAWAPVHQQEYSYFVGTPPRLYTCKQGDTEWTPVSLHDPKFCHEVNEEYRKAAFPEIKFTSEIEENNRVRAMWAVDRESGREEPIQFSQEFVEGRVDETIKMILRIIGASVEGRGLFAKKNPLSICIRGQVKALKELVDMEAGYLESLKEAATK